MTQPEWEQVQKIYHGALERSGGERSAYLDQACGDDRSLRSEIDNLPAAHAERSKFLEDPDMSVDFDVLANWAKVEGNVTLDVKRHLASEPVLAVAPSSVYRLRKFTRRNRTAIVVVTIMAVLLIGGTVVSTWQAWRASSAWVDADFAREQERTQRMAAETARDLAREQERKAIEEKRKQRLNSYSSDMKVAQVALTENNLGQADRILRRYLPDPGREDLRGVEWRYLWQASRGDEFHTFELGAMVTGARFGARAKRLATNTIDGKTPLPTRTPQ